MSEEKYVKFINALLKFESLDLVLKAINEVAFNTFEKTTEEIYEDFNLAVEEELKLKIEEMFNQQTPYRKARHKTDIYLWLSKFIPFKSEVEKLVEIYCINAKPYEIFNLKELLTLSKTKDSKFVVKRLLYRGSLHLLVAAPKVGKSLMASSLAVSVARGLPFLNNDSVQGNVLYIQNEEQLESTTIDRLHSHGLQFLELNNPQEYEELISSKRLLVARDIDIALEQDLILKLVEENNISLVIIDSLAASLKKSGLTEYNFETVQALYLLQSKCQLNDFTIVLIHHSTKMDTAPDDKLKSTFGVGGNNGLLRANDGIFKLFPKNKNGDEIILNSIPRQGEAINLTLTIEKDEACYWYFNVKDEKHLTEEMLELQNEILSLLYARYYLWLEENNIIDINEDFISEDYPPVYGYTLNELMEMTNQTKTTLVTRLNDMKLTEGIFIYGDKDTKKFIYHIHHSGESWMRVYLELAEQKRKLKEEEDKKKELYLEEIRNIASELVELIEKEDELEIKTLIPTLSKEERRDVLRELNEEEYNKLMLIYYPPRYNVGDIVKIISTGEVTEVTKVVWIKQSEKGYHKYSLKDKLKPYRIEHLTNETNSTSSS